VVPERQAIIRRGEPADAMFFVMDGEVEVDVRPNPVRLGKGQFFGEIALVTEGPRTATVTAVVETRLLALDRVDFNRLVQQHPELKTAIEAIASARLGRQESTAPAEPGGRKGG
jgi:voltage-gated potassium channel